MKLLYPLQFALLLIPLSLFSQTGKQEDHRFTGKQTLPFGVVESIDSKALEEKRVLNIYLPQGFHPDSARTYPVIYVLDGSAHEDFPHIAGLAQFMNMYQLLPPSIVVGIANVDRYRDFSYPSDDSLDNVYLPTNGGSEKFIRFLKDELRPFIDKHYKTSGLNTLIGQSMGGLLATEILFKFPDLFDQYLIVSPSLWWDRQKMIKAASTYLETRKNWNAKIYLSLGKEHPEMHVVADLLFAALVQTKAAGNPDMKVWYKPILDEDHATILHQAVYQGFKHFHPKPEKKKE